MGELLWSNVVTAAATLLGAMIGGLFQGRRERIRGREELKKERLRIRSESEVRAEEARKEELRKVLTDLIIGTDPEAGDPATYPELVRLVVRAQLLLDTREAAERELNDLLNRFASHRGGYTGGPISETDRFRIHGALITASRKVFGLTPLD